MTLSVDCSKNTSLMAKFSTTGSLVDEDVQAKRLRVGVKSLPLLSVDG